MGEFIGLFGILSGEEGERGWRSEELSRVESE